MKRVSFTALLLAIAASSPASALAQSVIPVRLPSIGEVTPKLTFRRDASQPNGWIGEGWALRGALQIERQGSGSDAHYTLDGAIIMKCEPDSRNVSCLAGGTHAAVDPTYVRIDLTAEGWTIQHSNGVRSTFEPRGSDAAGISRWVLAQQRDNTGKVASYTFSCAAQCQLQEIAYGDYLVRFETNAAPKSLAVLNRISVHRAGVKQRIYQLLYSEFGAGRMVLSSLKQTRPVGDGELALAISKR